MARGSVESNYGRPTARPAKRIAGEVRFDPFSRMLYSTDASIYQIEPIGVVLPRHADDVVATVEVARQHGVPVLPRGGGTGLAGQTIGKAIIIDMSNYMHQITETNTEEHWAWVQPGSGAGPVECLSAPPRLFVWA